MGLPCDRVPIMSGRSRGGVLSKQREGWSRCGGLDAVRVSLLRCEADDAAGMRPARRETGARDLVLGWVGGEMAVGALRLPKAVEGGTRTRSLERGA